jgi:hypothetical protein
MRNAFDEVQTRHYCTAAVTPLPSEKEELWRRTMRSLVPSVVLQPQENSPLKRLAQLLHSEYAQYYSAGTNRAHYTHCTLSYDMPE